MNTADAGLLDDRLTDALVATGMLAAGEVPRSVTALTGGVSSIVLRVVTEAGARFVVKASRPKLAVPGDWFAPLERAESEAAWLAEAETAVPGFAPRLLAADPQRHVLVLEDLGDAPVWKAQLRDGIVDVAIAGLLGRRLAEAHTAIVPTDAMRHDELFAAMRLDPYLGECARNHPDVADTIGGLRASLLAHRFGVVHGDVSPKNILVIDHAPVLLDAECAWWGDPAFDLAFLSTHLLLKCVWRPAHTAAYLAAQEAFVAAYAAATVDDEVDTDRLVRAGALTPAIVLARVDGLSPVEYLDAPSQAWVRAAASARLAAGPLPLSEIATWWRTVREELL